MFICLLPWFSPQVSTRYHEFRSVSMRLDHAVACIPEFIKKFSVDRPLLVASVFKAEEDGCYFYVHVHACVYMHVSNIFIHNCVHSALCQRAQFK